MASDWDANSLEADLSGREISCRAVGFLFDELAKAGHPPDMLSKGTGCTLDELRDAQHRISWTAFKTLMENAGQVWNDNELVALGRVATHSPMNRPFTIPFRLLYSAHDMYRAMTRPGTGAARQQFSCLQNHVMEMGPGHLVVDVVMDPGYPVCREFHYVIKGSMEAVPELLGLGRATVQMQSMPTGARLEIHHPLGGGALAWLRKVVTWPFVARSAARELEEAYVALHRRNVELEHEMVERRRTEQSLRLTEFAVESAGDAVFWIRPEGSIMHANKQASKLLGYSEEELRSKSLGDIDAQVGEDEWPRWWSRLREIGTATVESQYRRRDGAVFPVEVSGNYLEHEGQSYVCAFVRDITQRKRADEALRKSEAELRSVAESSPDYIMLLDLDGTILFINRTVPGRTVEQAIGTSVLEYLPAESQANYQGAAQRVIATAEPDRFEANYETPGSGRLYVESRVGPVIRDGQVMALAVIATDVTWRHDMVAQLEARNAELERFTYTVSHDLKSPLISIRGFLGLLEGDLVRGDRDAVSLDMKRIRDATDTMDHLLQDLLNLSRIGRIVHPPELVPFEEIVRQVQNGVSAQLVERAIDFRVLGTPPAIWGDRLRVVELFQNLVENAAKFTGDQPSPVIDIGGSARDGELLYYVRDNGIGVEPEYWERVFELFERLDPTVDGTGIGLALVKRIAGAHGGRVWMESDGLGTGSTFYVALPVPPGAKASNRTDQTAGT